MKVLIIGAGLAGLSASFHLKKEHLIIERESTIGGLCNSVNINGFWFDYTGHILFFKSNYCLNLIKERIGDNLQKLKRKSYIFLENKYIKYPFQINFIELSPQIVKECLKGFIQAQFKKDGEIPENFLEWIQRNFGIGMSKYFLKPYNEKLWKFPLDEMSYEIIEKYIPKISLDELLDNFLGIKKVDYGYNIDFYYPKKGGIKAISEGLLQRKSQLNLNTEITKINSAHNEAILNKTPNSKEITINYDKLISTIPLPELLKIIDDLPAEIKKDLSKFYYTSILCINYGIKREKISDKHWIYFPEKKFLFHRIGFPRNFSPYMVPKSSDSLYVEISYKYNEKINVDSISEQVIESLLDLGLINDKNEIIFEYPMRIPHAYVFYKKDFDYNSLLLKIYEFLKKQNIYTIGRFGSWNYSTMEDAILEGKRIADLLNSNQKI